MSRSGALKCFKGILRHSGNLPIPRRWIRGYTLRITACPAGELPARCVADRERQTIDSWPGRLEAMVTLKGRSSPMSSALPGGLRQGRSVKHLGEEDLLRGRYLADTVEAVRRGSPQTTLTSCSRRSSRYADEHGRTWGTPGAPARVPNLKDGIQQKAWFVGPPAQIIDGIKSIEAKYPGLEHFMIHWAEGIPPKEFKEQLRWFAREVMPAFAG